MVEKLEAYFVDSSLMPLMIQENYIRAKATTQRSLLGNGNPNFITLTAAAADSISAACHVDSMIRGSNQEWSLAPLHGFLSCVAPAYFVHGSLSGMIGFPGWFGKIQRREGGGTAWRASTSLFSRFTWWQCHGHEIDLGRITR